MAELMFGCLTRRVGLYLVAQVYVIIGLVLFVDLVYTRVVAARDITGLGGWKQHSCQGSACGQTHEALTCSQTAGISLELNTFILSAGGFIFGLMGVQGLVGRDAPMLLGFLIFICTQYGFALICFFGDLLYVHVCGRLPDSYWKVLYVVIPGRLQFIETMGLSPETLPPEILDELTGMHTVESIAIISGIGLSFFPYIIHHCYSQWGWMGKGPTGLGSAYGLRIESDDYATLMEVAQGVTHAVNDLTEEHKVHAPIGNLIRADQYQSAQSGRAVAYGAQGGPGEYGTF